MISFVTSIKDITDDKDERIKLIYDRLSLERRERFDKIKPLKSKLCLAVAELLLFKALGCDNISYRFGEYGKPYLVGDDRFFNISHSNDMVLLTLGESEMGCDIERVSVANMRLAKRFFHPEEYEQITSDYDFFKIWVMKESFVKLSGVGLSYGLNSFNVFDLDGEECFFKTKDIGGYIAAICSGNEADPFTPEFIELDSIIY